ncbi:DUF3801 domain-containing protein [Faecalibacterium prausnitzii]|uniref:DUF3801 domain-containing protein n=1 Tax=Faecalibacterium prausnitzii TaxID=853 RepID=UPI001FA8F262|nr:DUF3801 domain-containing protein [Faecalibacterium prausnitzii]
MQEEIEHKTVNVTISTAKLSARTLLRGAQFFLRQYDKSASQGKQSMKRLIRQNRGVTNVEIQKTGIALFSASGNPSVQKVPTPQASALRLKSILQKCAACIRRMQNARGLGTAQQAF